jgi:D-alanyl-D-alanine carboxypeptidase
MDTASPTRPEAADRVRLQQMLDELVAAGAMGALAQFRDGDSIWAGSSGVAELGSERPLVPDGWFRIGSVTKTFTAALILQLAGEGRLGLDDGLDRWLPGLVPGDGEITLLRLLDHTSGLYNYTDDLDAAGILRNRSAYWSPQQVVAMATKHEPRFPPGTSRAYCNTSYILLGMVIEKVTGSSYDAEVKRRILQPLNLRQTLAPGDAEVLPEPHARGYLMLDGQPVDITTINTSQAWAAGGMVSTAGDLNQFFRALLAGGLLRSSELRAMQTTIPTAELVVDGGLGVAQVTLPHGGVLWGKDGGAYSYHTLSFHTVEATRQLTVSITVTATARPATHELLTSVASVFSPGR